MQQAANIEASKDWEIQPVKCVGGEDYYTSNQLIDAYLKGKKDQQSSNQKVLMKVLEENLKKAQELSEQLYQGIESKGYTCNAVRLKIKNIHNFTSIFVIDLNDYFSDNFNEIYKKSIEVKKSHNEIDGFNFSVIFTPDNDNLLQNKMIADGYNISYNVITKSR